MKLIMSAVFCVAMAMAISGCRYDQQARFKHMPDKVDPASLFQEHVANVTRGRVQPFDDEWRKVKSQIHKPATSNQPYTATITAEVYEFGAPTITTPLARIDYDISLAFIGSKWTLKEVKKLSGEIQTGKWQAKGSKEPVAENSTDWQYVARRLVLP
jgi:hypothetical protein